MRTNRRPPTTKTSSSSSDVYLHLKVPKPSSQREQRCFFTISPLVRLKRPPVKCPSVHSQRSKTNIPALTMCRVSPCGRNTSGEGGGGKENVLPIESNYVSRCATVSGVKDKSTRMWRTPTGNRFAVCAFLTGGGRRAQRPPFLLCAAPSERPHSAAVNYDTKTFPARCFDNVHRWRRDRMSAMLNVAGE